MEFLYSFEQVELRFLLSSFDMVLYMKKKKNWFVVIKYMFENGMMEQYVYLLFVYFYL